MFGIVDIQHQPALDYMEIVPRRNAATLLPIIGAPGTEVWSDEWAAYCNVGNLPNVASHRTVNHSVNFLDPSILTTRKLLEPYKIKFKRMFQGNDGWVFR